MFTGLLNFLAYVLLCLYKECKIIWSMKLDVFLSFGLRVFPGSLYFERSVKFFS